MSSFFKPSQYSLIFDCSSNIGPGVGSGVGSLVGPGVGSTVAPSSQINLKHNIYSNHTPYYLASLTRRVGDIRVYHLLPKKALHSARTRFVCPYGESSARRPTTTQNIGDNGQKS